MANRKKHHGVYRGRSGQGGEPSPRTVYCRPVTHPLWLPFVSWVTMGPLAKDIVNDDMRFDRDGRIMWLTFLEGARVVYDHYKTNGQIEEKKLNGTTVDKPATAQVS